jgi:uncharacterized membrane protein
MVGLIIVTLLMWTATILFLMGRGANLIAGYNTMPREAKAEDGRINDVKARNKYLGKMYMLPITLLFTLASVLRLFGVSVLVQSGNLSLIVNGWVTVLFAVGFVIYTIFIIIQLNSEKFKRKT